MYTYIVADSVFYSSCGNGGSGCYCCHSLMRLLSWPAQFSNVSCCAQRALLCRFFLRSKRNSTRNPSHFMRCYCFCSCFKVIIFTSVYGLLATADVDSGGGSFVQLSFSRWNENPCKVWQPRMWTMCVWESFTHSVSLSLSASFSLNGKSEPSKMKNGFFPIICRSMEANNDLFFHPFYGFQTNPRT